MHSPVRGAPPITASMTSKTLAREGEKSYREAYDLIHRREATRPNELWQADHTQLDLWARRDDGQVARPWLSVVIDDHSRAAAGFLLSFESPSAAQTALALRQAIWRKPEAYWTIFGILEALYTCTPTTAATSAQRISNRSQPISNAPDLLDTMASSWPRPHRALLRHRQSDAPLHPAGLHRRGRGARHAQPDSFGPRSTVPRFPARLSRPTEWRDQAAAAGALATKRLPDSLEQLDLLPLTVAKIPIVQPDGIRFHGMRYIDPALAAYIGESVLLRYDLRDLAEVRLFHNGKFFCRAICPELAGQTIALRDIRRARDQRRQELQQKVRARRTTVDSLLDLRRGGPPRPECDAHSREVRRGPATLRGVADGGLDATAAP
jgi:putative transposase